MKLELEFQPDIIVYFRFMGKAQHCNECSWGNREIYNNSYDLIKKMLPEKNCFFCTVKGLGKFQIIEGNINIS